MTETCWYGRFCGPQCNRPARWKSSNELIAQSGWSGFMRAVRWCDEHRHENDVLIEDEDPSDG